MGRCFFGKGVEVDAGRRLDGYASPSPEEAARASHRGRRSVGVHQARTAGGAEEWGGSYAMAASLAQHHVAHSVTLKLLDTPHDG